jgi:hypothetical protein
MERLFWKISLKFMFDPRFDLTPEYDDAVFYACSKDEHGNQDVLHDLTGGPSESCDVPCVDRGSGPSPNISGEQLSNRFKLVETYGLGRKIVYVVAQTVKKPKGTATCRWAHAGGESWVDWPIVALYSLGDPKAIAHETGHFLGLEHTFRTDDGSKGDDPIQNIKTIVAAHLMAGGSRETALEQFDGDRRTVADTPPEPYALASALGYKDSNCEYADHLPWDFEVLIPISSARPWDFKRIPFRIYPDRRNVMNYSGCYKTRGSTVSDGQLQRILDVLVQPHGQRHGIYLYSNGLVANRGPMDPGFLRELDLSNLTGLPRSPAGAKLRRKI